MGDGLPDDFDGRVLAEMISDEHISRFPVRYCAGVSLSTKREVEYSDEENAEIIESLKNLGYMG